MSANPAISDIHVFVSNVRSYTVMWRTRDARYHFNLYDGATKYKDQPLYKNPLVEHGQPGYFVTRRLNGTAQANREMITRVMTIVRTQEMISIADSAQISQDNTQSD